MLLRHMPHITTGDFASVGILKFLLMILCGDLSLRSVRLLISVCSQSGNLIYFFNISFSILHQNRLETQAVEPEYGTESLYFLFLF